MSLNKDNVEDILALAPMQEAMLFYYVSQPGNDQYFEQIHLKINGDISLPLFKEAWQFVTDSNEALRTVFRWEGLNAPAQIVLKKHPVALEFHDLESSPTAPSALIEQMKAAELKKGFDLNLVPFRIILCRENSQGYHVIINNHHIIYDGWSNRILLSEFLSAYSRLQTGRELTVPVKTRYKEFIKYLKKETGEEQSRFWRNYLYDYQAADGFFETNVTAFANYQVGDYGVTVSPSLTKKLDSLAKEKQLTLASIFYTAWGVCLHKYHYCDDLVFGTVVSGRNAFMKGIGETIGLFINTVPLRVKAGSDDTALQLLVKVNQDLKNRTDFEGNSLSKIKQVLGVDQKKELFDSIVVIENYSVNLEQLFKENKLRLMAYESSEPKTNFSITVEIRLFEAWEIRFNYKKHLFTNQMIGKIAALFVELLERMATYPGIDLDTLMYGSEDTEDVSPDLDITFDF